MTEYIILSEEEIQQLLAGEEIPHEANTRNYIICSRACFRKNNPGIAKALFDKDVTTVQVEKCKNCKYFDYDISFCNNDDTPFCNVNTWNRCEHFELKEHSLSEKLAKISEAQDVHSES